MILRPGKVIGVRAQLLGLLVVGMVAVGCSGDDDAATPTTTVASVTTVAPTTVAPPVTEAATTTTTTLPTHQIGETVDVWEGATLTITSVEADVPDCGVVDQEGQRRVGLLKGDEERFVLIRGTYDDNGTGLYRAEDLPSTRSDQPVVAIGARLSERDDADGRGYPNTGTPAGTEFPVEVEWCFFIPAGKPSWTFTAPILFSHPRDWSPSEWDVSV